MANTNTIFLAYAFRYPEVRAAVENAAHGLAIVKCADSQLTGQHLLDKIEVMMTEATVNLFDLTGYNVNVAVEYGLARGMKLSPYLLYNEDEAYRPSADIPDVFADVRGLDGIRYRDFDRLSSRLRKYLPDLIARASAQPPVLAPRLQMDLEGRADPNGTAFFIGSIFNASDVPAERVQYALAGYVDLAGVPPRRERVGTLVREQAPKRAILRYDDLSMMNQATGMEHVLVEFSDAAGQRYEQRGRLIPHRDVTGRYSYAFDGLTAPKTIDRFALAPTGLEDR
jgi:hypothetical protein